MNSIKKRITNVFQDARNAPYNNGQTRFDAIDGLRALAVLSVIAYHFDTGFLPAGFIGVDIFFVISGYVIALSLTKNTKTSIAGYILSFYKRRILRIMPALVVCLVFTGMVSQLFVPDSWLSISNDKTGLTAFFGLANFALLEGVDGYFNVRAEFNPFLHTWSLAVEEQFYLFFPLLLLPWLKKDFDNGLFAYLRNNLVLMTGVLSLVWAALETSREPQLAFYMLPSRFWELAAGAVLFQYHSKGDFAPRSVIGVRLNAVFGLILIALSLVSTNIKAFPFPWAVFPVAGTLALIGAARSPVPAKPYIIQVLNNPLVAYLGRASYSLYLWHWPVVVMMRWTIGFETITHIATALVLTLILGITSYHLVERTFLSLRQLCPWPAWGVVSAGITFTLGAAVGFNLIASSHCQLSVVNKQAGWHPYDMPDIGCSSSSDLGEAAPTLWVIGDSHAGAYIGMVREASARAGMRFQIKGIPGCSVANLFSPNPNSGICRNSLNRLLTDPSQHYTKGDVVFLASLRGQRVSDQWGMLGPGQLDWILNSDRSNMYSKALEESRQIIGEILSLGFKVIIDAPKPVFRAPVFRCSDWFNRMNPVCGPGFEVSKNELLEIDEPVLQSLHTLKAEYPELVIWDPFPILCPGSICSVMRDGKPLFFDQDHLSGYGNQLLVESFTKLLQGINNIPGELPSNTN